MTDIKPNESGGNGTQYVWDEAKWLCERHLAD